MSKDCTSLRRRIWEHVVLPLDEREEFAETTGEIAAKVKTDDKDLASAILAEAEKIATEPHDRADGAERRATTLQGAVAIAASFGLASGALLLDSSKIKSDGWRQAFAVLSFGFVFSLVAAGFRAVSAVYRVHYWSYPDNEQILELPAGDHAAAEMMTRRAASLLRTVARNQAIARWKVAYMRAAAWWFRIALAFLVADALLLVVYAFFGSRIPHLHVPFDRSPGLDRFFVLVTVAAVLVVIICAALAARPPSADRRQLLWLGLLLVVAVAAGVCVLEDPGSRVYTPLMRYLGLVVIVIAVLWTAWSYRLLGPARSGAYEPRAGGRLQTGGAFAVVRHPIYLGYALTPVGFGLLFSPYVLIVAAGLLIVGYDAARLEEPLLSREYQDYGRYRECTRNRILPLDHLARWPVRTRGTS